MVSLLLANGAEPGHELLASPLLVDLIGSPVSTDDKIKVLRRLTRSRCPNLVNVADRNGMTPLLHAAAAGDLDIVQWLLRNEADVDARDSRGRCALYYALVNKHERIVRDLLARKPQLNVSTTDGQTLLETAMEQVSMVRLLLDAGADTELGNKRNRTALIVAVLEKKTEVVQLLVERRANVHHRDKDGFNPILIATAHSTDADIVRILAEAGANLNDAHPATGDTPLHLAMKDGNMEKTDCIIRELIDHGADVNATGGFSIFNAICAAAFSAGASTIELLLGKGASVHIPDPLGRLPIHFAAASGIKNFEAVASVYQDDLMICDKAGKNVLHWAAQFGHVETIKAIL
ncbi:uncharacterized protein TRIREDRAFT_53570, partial [Trichoderma reesei QM6a]